MKLLSFEDLPVTPWKNGAGVTCELYRYPVASTFEDFLWRVSLADVAQSGDFSSFPGVDRIITLLQGDGMRLCADSGADVVLSRLQPYSFRGEEKIVAQLENGACQDLNLMLRRAAAVGEIQVCCGDQEFQQDCHLLFCVQGGWDVLAADGQHATLEARQTLISESTPGRLALRSLSAASIILSVHIKLL